LARLGFLFRLGVLAAEALDPPGGVQQLLLAGKERMAIGADLQVDVAFVRGTRGERVPTGAGDPHLVVHGMNAGLHSCSGPLFGNIDSTGLPADAANAGIGPLEGRFWLLAFGQKLKANSQEPQQHESPGSSKERGAGQRLFVGLLTVNCLLEFGPCSELRHSLGSDLDGFAGLGIAAGAGLALRRGERPEAHQRHAVALLQRRGDAVDGRIQRCGSLGLGDPRFPSNLVDDISLIHVVCLQAA